MREGAVCKELAANLATRAIIALILCVDDALHLRAADRTGLAKFPVHRHLRMEGNDFFWKAVISLRWSPSGRYEDAPHSSYGCTTLQSNGLKAVHNVTMQSVGTR